jgi:hypothetical protein
LIPAALIATNAVVFFVAWAVGVLLLRPVILELPLVGRLGGEYGIIGVGVSLTFALAGGLTRVWSPHWVIVVVPAWLSFEIALTLLEMAIYLGDGGSEALMWTYIWPDAAAWVVGAVASLFAVGGYLTVSTFATRRSDAARTRA